MYKAFCDSKDCGKPIAPEDNHLEIAKFGLVDKGQIFRADTLHFCGKGCLCKWLDQVNQRPMILVPPHAQN